jgi:hypothetical protein
MTEERVSDEKLAEIIAGCEGVTAGPWEARDENFGGRGARWAFGQPGTGRYHTLGRVLSPQDGTTGANALNAAHIARLDPDTIRSLLTELQHRRSQDAGGWRLVPVEPTEAMCGAALDPRADGSASMYRAMIAAAPSPTMEPTNAK